VSPLAESRPYAGARGELAAVSKVAEGALAARLPLLGLELIKGRGETAWVVLARFGGGALAVERALGEFEALAAAAGCPTFRPDEVVYAGGSAAGVRASVLPQRTAEMAAAVAEAGAAVYAYPGVGAVQGSWAEAPDADVVTALRRRALEAGGALVLAKAPLELKRAAGVWGEPQGDFALMQRLKQQFDPGRTLNPGRFVGGI
jgi:glycolate oxidase FAD binding subunit